ncbi:MAG: hypothetical protein KGJ60_02270 [Verrucomicrobiota bacterium]|nr:hypothetical protein [Verrucomicrobiota bacterium]
MHGDIIAAASSLCTDPDVYGRSREFPNDSNINPRSGSNHEIILNVVSFLAREFFRELFEPIGVGFGERESGAEAG